MRIVDSSALYRKAKKPCIGLCYLKKIGKVSQIAEDEEEEVEEEVEEDYDEDELSADYDGSAEDFSGDYEEEDYEEN